MQNRLKIQADIGNGNIEPVQPFHLQVMNHRQNLRNSLECLIGLEVLRLRTGGILHLALAEFVLWLIEATFGGSVSLGGFIPVTLLVVTLLTLGERAEDVFLISGGDLRDAHHRIRLETELMERLKV